MADKTVRVRILRHVQGENTNNGEREILTKGSVVEVPGIFGAELLGSKAAELVESDEKLVTVPLHPPEKTK